MWRREYKGKIMGKRKRKIFLFLMSFNLNDHQINMDCYLLRMLYMNLRVATYDRYIKNNEKEIQTKHY